MRIYSDNKLINAIGFQLCWWLIALYKQEYVRIAIALIVLHFQLLKFHKTKEVIFVFFISIIGIAIDSLLLSLGVFNIENPLDLGVMIIPFWLMVLWVSFSLTLNHCLSWIFNRNLVLIFFGGAGGALSYVGAAKLGALESLLPPAQFFITLFFVWVMVFFIAKTIRGWIFKPWEKL